MNDVDDMTRAETDYSEARRTLRRRAVWTLLGMSITLVVFAAVFARAI
jgi:hypothetical protein